MKKKLVRILILSALLISVTVVAAKTEHAAQNNDSTFIYNYYDELDPQQQLQYEAAMAYLNAGMWDSYVKWMLNPGCRLPVDLKQAMIRSAMNNHPELKAYADQFAAAGLYSGPATTPEPAKEEAPKAETTTPAPQEQPKEEPKEEVKREEFTVTKLDKTMWATNEVNTRDGATVSYNKVGSLKKYEEVHVTGKASTGWYRIDVNGAEAYVSDKYLSEENPVTNTEVPEKSEKATETDTDNNVAAEEVSKENIKEDVNTEENIDVTEITEEKTEEIIKEMPQEDTEESIQEEPVNENLEMQEADVEVEEESVEKNSSALPFVLIGVTIVIVGAGATFVVFKKKKNL